MLILETEPKTKKPEDEKDYESLQWSRSDELKEVVHTLISHHPPSQYGHCLRVSFMGRSIYFCSRCTGLYGGLGIGVLAIALLGIALEPSWLWFLIALALGFTTVVDWMTQRISPRKTTNHIRFVTGTTSGIGLAIVFLLANLVYMLLTLGVMVFSVAIVSILENKLSPTKSELLPFDETLEDEE